jgi:hypothetical protein
MEEMAARCEWIPSTIDGSSKDEQLQKLSTKVVREANKSDGKIVLVSK